MVMEPPRQYAAAGVRVDTDAGKLFVAFPALGDGGDEEVEIDVGPAQMARLAEACAADNGGAVTPPPPEMGVEEMEGLKGEIMKRTSDRRPFYPGKIAGDMGLDLDTVMKAIKSLEREGKIVESKYG